MALDSGQDPERLNSGFAQIYPKGWRRLRWLLQQKPTAASLYTWLAEHMDPNGGVLVVSQAVMADAMGLSEITIRRLTAWMEEHHVIVRVRVGTGVYAYALDPDEVWKSWDNKKDFAVFRTKTLVSKTESHNQDVARRIQLMIREREKEENDGSNLTQLSQPMQGETTTDHDPETGEVKP